MHERITQRQVFDRYLTESEEKRLFKCVGAIDSPLAKRDLQWMILARQTGLRIGSIAGLTVADANEALASRHLTVRDEIAKGKRGYSVLVTNKAHTALRTLLRLRREQRLSADPEAPLIWSRQNQRMTVRQLQKRMQHWVTVAQLQVRATPHWWRHTLAKRLVARSTSNQPQSIVQAVLGHRSMDSTAIYILPDRDQIRADMESAS